MSGPKGWRLGQACISLGGSREYCYRIRHALFGEAHRRPDSRHRGHSAGHPGPDLRDHPAGSLPSFIPGHLHGSTGHHPLRRAWLSSWAWSCWAGRGGSASAARRAPAARVSARRSRFAHRAAPGTAGGGLTLGSGMSFTDRLLLWFHIGFVIFAIGPVTIASMSTPRYIRARNVGVLRYLSRMTRILRCGVPRRAALRHHRRAVPARNDKGVGDRVDDPVRRGPGPAAAHHAGPAPGHRRRGGQPRGRGGACGGGAGRGGRDRGPGAAGAGVPRRGRAHRGGRGARPGGGPAGTTATDRHRGPRARGHGGAGPDRVARPAWSASSGWSSWC